MSEVRSDAPSLRESVRLQPNDPAVLACLKAARGHSLVQRYVRGGMKLSAVPDYGWWGAATYGASMEAGGPWSVEFVHQVCELGLLAMDPKTANWAIVTKAGREVLRLHRPKASTGTRKDGSSLQTQTSEPSHG